MQRVLECESCVKRQRDPKELHLNNQTKVHLYLRFPRGFLTLDFPKDCWFFSSADSELNVPFLFLPG